MTNQIVLQMTKELRQASKKNNAPIWLRLAELAMKPSRARRVMNLGQLDKFVTRYRKHITQDNALFIFHIHQWSKESGTVRRKGSGLCSINKEPSNRKWSEDNWLSNKYKLNQQKKSLVHKTLS